MRDEGTDLDVDETVGGVMLHGNRVAALAQRVGQHVCVLSVGDGGSQHDNDYGHTGGYSGAQSGAAIQSGNLGNAQDTTKLLGALPTLMEAQPEFFDSEEALAPPPDPVQILDPA